MRTNGKWTTEWVKALSAWHPQYDEEARLLRKPFSSPGYHTTLKGGLVHPTRESLVYAVALLDSGEEEHRSRAFDIIDRVVSLQDTDRSSPTFGIWSWFYEEPLAMMSPPDWNWADFCGKQLLLAAIRHGGAFPPELLERTERAVLNSCDAIIKRDVGPDYTNIAIMGAFVTLIAGERFGEARCREYGLERLAKFYRHTKEQGTFTEYNSPTYTIVAIEELSSIATETRLEDAKVMVAELLDTAWEMVAYHFHPVLKQWSGPHSRAYRTMLNAGTLTFLQMACGGNIRLLPDERLEFGLTWYGNDIRCPDKYVPYFLEAGERERAGTIAKPKDGAPPRTATMYMNGAFSLGTFGSEIMWNQRRNLLAYVANGDGCAYVHLRVLRDGYDLSSAVFAGVQRRGDVLYAIRFATDGGGTHPNLDPVNGVVRASDLRIRLEIGGSREGLSIDRREGAVDIRFPGVRMRLVPLHGTLGGATAFDWDVADGEDTTGVDLVLYAGEPREFDFRSIPDACFVFALSISESDIASTASINPTADEVECRLVPEKGGDIRLTVSTKPDTIAELHANVKTGRNDP
ncbi:hypothetical protein [Paenibacillus flagellatus]|uniref:Heparinase n=1 Tax=Paenibacillus flagellatus TaxID=2211139 RepID=A0A2V5KQD6_9BACL|nr:hypothetical protein [Paenibacillus flagellatus]PYI53517.1 hypothetical protein DLM86_17275 [Paenibacillus flagellatus]